MERDFLEEQIAYYSARAPEYQAKDPAEGPLRPAHEALMGLGPCAHVLELACGTGVWTKELARIGDFVTAVDASPEMLEINRRIVADPRVRYQQHDLFTWQPEDQYDLVFVGFWLSHVPPDLLEPFLDRICRAVRPRGHLILIDQCDDLRGGPVPDREGICERRSVTDGRTFTIVKVYYHPGVLALRLARAGFDARAHRIGDSFFYVIGRRV